jgi:hypothetical protein
MRNKEKNYQKMERLVHGIKVNSGVQRAGLYAGWELVFRPPTTAAD